MDRLSDAILGSLAETEPQVSIQRFHLDPAEIERSVHDDLARGQLSPVETRRYTAMAGAFAAAHRRYDEAAEYQQRVLNLCQPDCPPAELAGACYDLANTQLALKQFAEAEANFNRAAHVCLEHQIQPMLAMVLCNLGVVLQRQNRIDDALRSLDVARRTFSAIGNPPAEAHVLDCAARVLAQAGRRDEAEEAWRSALALYDGIDNPAMRDVREHGRDDLLEKLRGYLEQTGQAGKLAAIAAEVRR
jgi:tetratricopeptide (TPR) repeat protein